jgi:hypothetical protein
MARSNPYGQRNDGGWCRCAECGRTFGGLSGFDAHRMDSVKDPYDWRCATDAELKAKCIRLSGRGWWVRQDGPSTPRLSTQTPAGAR